MWSGLGTTHEASFAGERCPCFRSLETSSGGLNVNTRDLKTNQMVIIIEISVAADNLINLVKLKANLLLKVRGRVSVMFA